jgi:Protein-L-isoaspartate carboxylmethyltransferase
MDMQATETLAARKAMVDSQVKVNDVTDRALLSAMLEVPREQFCATDRAFAAYNEVEVPVADDRSLMLARDLSKLLMVAEPRSGETALVLSGGYAAALLATMGLNVTLQESSGPALERVRPALEAMGVTCVEAPLREPTGGGYDLIVSEGAVPGRMDSWLSALSPKGRLAVVERQGPVGKAALYVNTSDGNSRAEMFNAAPPLLAELVPSPTFAL